MHRRRAIGIAAAVALLLVVASCGLGAAAHAGSDNGLPKFRIHLGSVQLTVGPTRFAHCRPSFIGARCEPIGGDPGRIYYAVALHEKTPFAGLWRERSRWIIALP